MISFAQVYGVPIGGTLVRQQWTTDGSGSTYLWGYLDSAYKRAPAACFMLSPCVPGTAGFQIRSSKATAPRTACVSWSKAM